jgi:hypothetical protein
MATAKTKSGKSPCARHRDAQARYVRKDPQAQRDRVKRHYKQNRAKVLARKTTGAKRKRGGKIGRPRTGCKS